MSQERRPVWFSRELLQELRKIRVYQLQKKGMLNQKTFKDIVRSCILRIRDAKAQIELNQANFF